MRSLRCPCFLRQAARRPGTEGLGQEFTAQCCMVVTTLVLWWSLPLTYKAASCNVFVCQ